MQVNSVDWWGRHRIEGYSFVRMPQEPGYHQIEVECWRPRGSLNSEIHSFFLGGSIRIHKLEEIVRTKYLDEIGNSDVVNRFGLETENSGRIKVNLNLCHQNFFDRKEARSAAGLLKEATLVETKRQVNSIKLKLKKQVDDESRKNMAEQYKAGGVSNEQLQYEPEYNRHN